jgi:hypothetical protein
LYLRDIISQRKYCASTRRDRYFADSLTACHQSTKNALIALKSQNYISFRQYLIQEKNEWFLPFESGDVSCRHHVSVTLSLSFSFGLFGFSCMFWRSKHGAAMERVVCTVYFFLSFWQVFMVFEIVHTRAKVSWTRMQVLFFLRLEYLKLRDYERGHFTFDVFVSAMIIPGRCS